MNLSCSHCRQLFDLTDDEWAFIQRMKFSFGETTVLPQQPTMCPACRMQVRTCHRNEKNLHRNVSAKSGKNLISIFAAKPLWGSPYKVYMQEEWNDDNFDPLAYGRDFDFSKPFFEQFANLSKDVPHMAVVTISNENSDYTTGTGYCKNCYLINSSEYCQDCFYGKLYQNCTDVSDSAYMYTCELCYGCFSLHDCTRCTYVSFSKNCHECLFSSNLQGCRNCFLCTNLTQKEYHFRNQPLSKEEYEKRVSEFLGSYEKFEACKKELHDLMQKKIWKYANIVDSENCTGDYIDHSRNCIECFDMTDSQDCRYVQVGVSVKDTYHCSNMYLKPELCYETLGTIEAYNCAYCLYVFYSQNMLYCESCYYCHDCFGCSGLKRKQFCIFNKQYTKEEYEILVPKIIAHMQKNDEWGQFFPAQYAAIGYNESVAGEYMPLSKEEAKAQGFLWRDREDEPLQVEKIVPAGQLPDHIEDIPDDILQWAIACEETGRPFKIQKRELDILRQQHIPLPRLHPDLRYDKRMKLRNPRQLWERTCMNCQKSIQTTYSPDRPEMIFCEDCYLKAVY